MTDKTEVAVDLLLVWVNKQGIFRAIAAMIFATLFIALIAAIVQICTIPTERKNKIQSNTNEINIDLNKHHVVQRVVYTYMAAKVPFVIVGVT